MLAHSPPLPLAIDYVDERHGITSEDEEGILLALRHHDRVRRIRLTIPAPALRNIINALGKEFPMLEYLYVVTRTNRIPSLILPETFQAPQIHHLLLRDFAFFPITSPFLTTAVGLVTLRLWEIPPSSYFRPSALLHRLSLMPQVEALGIFFHSTAPDHEKQLLHTQNMAHATLLRLYCFEFRGDSAYSEVLLPRMTIPAIEKLDLCFFDQPTFSVPHLRQFANARKVLTASRARLIFADSYVLLAVYSNELTRIESFYIGVRCRNPHKQVASAAQIFNALATILSGAECLILYYENHVPPSDGNNEGDRTQWHELLKSFENVKTIQVPHRLIKVLSRALQLDDGESPTEFLPRLEKLECFGYGYTGDAFTGFIDARRNAGYPVTLVNR